MPTRISEKFDVISESIFLSNTSYNITHGNRCACVRIGTEETTKSVNSISCYVAQNVFANQSQSRVESGLL